MLAALHTDRMLLQENGHSSQSSKKKKAKVLLTFRNRIKLDTNETLAGEHQSLGVNCMLPSSDEYEFKWNCSEMY